VCCSFANVMMMVASRPRGTALVLRPSHEAALVRDEASRSDVSALRLSQRALALTVIFAPVTLSAWLAVLVPVFRRRVWYKALRWSLGSAGAAFVKWSQWSATRADLFPAALRKELEKLQAAAPTHSWRYSLKAIERATGSSSFLESLEKAPMGSGSIAQVHRGVLRGGRPVAVKIRHPNVAERLALDSRLMVLAATSVDLIAPWLKFAETVAQFSETLAAQARLDVESDHLVEFGRNFKQWRDVRFPKPIFAAPSLLVETFEPGRLVNGWARSPEGPPPPDVGAYLVNRGEDVYLKMLLVDKFMHADLHPGNLLYDGPSRKRAHAPPGKKKRSVALVDAGMAARIDDVESAAFVGLIGALGAADATAAAACLLRFSPSNDAALNPRARAAFAADVADLFAQRCRGYGTGVDFGDVVRGLLELLRKHKVRIDANYATLIINALCLDGLAKDLYPSYSVLDGAKPLLVIHRFLCGKQDKVENNNKGILTAIAPRRRLGSLVFHRLCLPVAWRLKRAHDRGMVRNAVRTTNS